MTRRRKTLLVAIVLLAAAGGFAWYWRATAVGEPAGEPRPVVNSTSWAPPAIMPVMEKMSEPGVFMMTSPLLSGASE